MSRPDDYRGRIGAPREFIRDHDVEGRDEFRRYPSTIQPARSRPRDSEGSRRDLPPARRKEGGKDPNALRIHNKVVDGCIVKDYVIRDGQVHEHENYFEFVKKLLESVNTSLSTKLIKGSYEVKKISAVTSDSTSDEQKRLTTQLRHADQAKHCQIVIMGLPKSIFVGNGFGTERTAVYSASKDLVDKMHRIGFITQTLYEVISGDRHFDTKRKLPDFSKTIDCFVTFERQMISPRGDLIAGWPRDLLDALDQPPQVFDKLSDVFKKISREIHGSDRVTGSRTMITADDDIERKIAKQREELLRRERAREMIEPLEEMGPLGGAYPMPQMMPGMPYGAAMRTAYGLPMITAGMPGLGMPGMPFVPPVGIVNPISRGSTRDNTRAVDMEIDHPYRRKNSPPPRRSRRDDSGERRARERENERKRRDEAERLKRKEEELERKIREEERRKLDIEAEVRRRLDEELAKRSVAVLPPTRQSFGDFSTVSSVNHNTTYDQEMQEIRQLVGETQQRLQQLSETDYDTGISATTLRTLASLGDRACDMDSVQRGELIVELRAILGHGAAAVAAAAPPQQDGWHHPRLSNVSPPVLQRLESGSYYERDRDHREQKKRSRSRSRERSRGRDSSRYESSSRRRDEDERRTGTNQKAQECAFCTSLYHTADLCHLFSSPTARKQELKKTGRCQSCLKKHYGNCLHSSRCDYCGDRGHHRAICDHPEHIRKLAALRELAK